MAKKSKKQAKETSKKDVQPEVEEAAEENTKKATETAEAKEELTCDTEAADVENETSENASSHTINAALSNPKADLAALDELEEHLFALSYAAGELSTFGPILDPPETTEDRAYAMSRLMQDSQELLCAPEIGDVLKRLEENAGIIGDTHAAQVRILKRDRAQLLDVPPEEQAELTRLGIEAEDVWRRAKLANDWESFEPYLDRLVEMQVRFASYKDAKKDPYDVWLNEYEWGRDRAFYDSFFSEVKSCVVPLLADVVASGNQPSLDCVTGSFDEERQMALARDLVAFEGVNNDAFWLGTTEHPFMGGPGMGFVVVATHVYKDDVLSGVYSILHEGGHALYEQNVKREWRRTSLRGGTSSGMHEAQSRFMENYVGRSRAFMAQLLEMLQKHFPGRFARVAANQLYLAANRAEPSLIRTEADELTYPLHIIVRYELEQLLFSGEAKAKDIPGLWSEKYKSYLGIEVPDHTRGALQDTHWALGDFGYFPTYALGSAYGAQFKARMIAEGMDFDGLVAAGNLAPIREWLQTNIWQWGRSKDSEELIENACKEPFSAHYFCDYLEEKFRSIYRI